MPVNPQQPQPDDEVSRPAAPGGPGCWTRLAARLFCPSRRQRADGASESDASTSEVPWPVRRRVLREHHAVNLSPARRACEAMVRAGFNTGAVPYGYRAHRVRVTPAGKRPRWRTRLVIEPTEAKAVNAIFSWRVDDRLSIAEISQRLVAIGYPAPVDPESGQPGAWTRATVKTVLRNPKYTGRQVWGRRHRGRRAPRTRWVWSPGQAHPPLITVDKFMAANRNSRLVAIPPPGYPEVGTPSEQGRCA